MVKFYFLIAYSITFINHMCCEKLVLLNYNRNFNNFVQNWLRQIFAYNPFSKTTLQKLRNKIWSSYKESTNFLIQISMYSLLSTNSSLLTSSSTPPKIQSCHKTYIYHIVPQHLIWKQPIFPGFFATIFSFLFFSSLHVSYSVV